MCCFVANHSPVRRALVTLDVLARAVAERSVLSTMIAMRPFDRAGM